ncbi:hypothetical protein [Flavobacterium sp. KACC 22761]|uniref:hypothetical protein n=1 Tax=Flavobacterium sp. KACC 22761 TaxID=3092665 RepID=UPI002A7568B1|nr:hypothetical protein [Flavobacterium sp. KACC 22761]WPO80512.1 hypothetical protein SCB73_09010 [Flavobacterium sp. KACC 22761]
MKNSRKKIIFLCLFGLLLNIPSIHSQSVKETEIFNWFDKNAGIESLDIKNGPAHLNFDKTINNQHRYYGTDEFKKGSINYNGQNYFDVYLKYDIYADQLVLRPYDQQNTTKINLLKANIAYFKIGDENFVKLDELNNSLFKGGYYNETLIKNNQALYIKYFKEKKKNIKEELDLIDYKPRYEFVLWKDNKFNLINEKKEIIALFPESKRNINDFYLMNRSLRKENPPIFMKNLMKYINN